MKRLSIHPILTLAAVLALAASAARAQAGDPGFTLASKHPATVDKALTYTDADKTTTFKMAACRGEFEAVTLTVLAARDLNAVTAAASALAGPGGAAIPPAAWEVRWQYKQVTGSGQAEQNRSLLAPALKPQAIKAGANLRFWLTVHVPADAAPGTYAGTVTVTADGAAVPVPLELTVHAFTYGPLPGAHAAVIGVTDDLVHYRDCAEHGMTTICGGSGGQLVENPDGSVRLPELDKNLKLSMAVGLKSVFLTGLGPLVPTSKVKNTTHILTYKHYLHPQRALKIMASYRDICKAEGLPEVIWYLFDEPGKGDTKQLGPLRFKESELLYSQAAEIPGVRTILTVQAEEVEEFGKTFAIHCYGGAPTPDDCRHTRECGGEVWRYSNGISMGTDPFYSRWAMGYFPWGCGWQGSTSWTYPCEVMGDDGKPVPPDVWEAMREGVDDWYYLLTLGELIAGNPAAPAAVEARKWLDALRGRIDPKSERKNPFADGREMDQVRAAAAGFIEKLAAK